MFPLKINRYFKTPLGNRKEVSNIFLLEIKMLIYTAISEYSAILGNY